MARKMGRNLMRALAGAAAAGAIALCAVSPAWGEGRAADAISVTVPTRIECALGADGTVTAPGGLEVVNNGTQELYVGASTLDDFGHRVDFDLGLGGSALLSRKGGRDTRHDGVLPGSSRKGLGLTVGKLNRASHAALMDAAAQGSAPMFTVQFDFQYKALQGSLTIEGEPVVGSTLTARVSGQQADARLSYRWYRDGKPIAGVSGASYAVADADAGKKIKCEIADADGKYVGMLAGEVGPVKGPEAFAVFSADDGSLNFYKRVNVPKAGEQFDGRTATEVYTGIETDRYSTYTKVPWYWNHSKIVKSQVVDTIKPESTAFWFEDCDELTSIDFSHLDTSNVINMREMFYYCRSLTSLNLSNFDTSNVTNMSFMFWGCGSLTSLDLSSFNTAAVTNMGSMFDSCYKLPSLDLSSFNTAAVTNMGSMFSSCTSLTSLDLSSFNTAAVTNMGSMFDNCRSLPSLNLSNFDTSNVTNMSYMFSGCYVLPSLNLSNFNTANVTKMNSMFSQCDALTTLELSSFDTSNVTDMSHMFSRCLKLPSLNLSNFNTANVTNMWSMFSGCYALTSLDLSSFNTAAVTNMGSMFSSCTSLTSLDLSSFNTEKVTDIYGMFSNCRELASLNLSKFDTSIVTRMTGAFKGCMKLRQVTLGARFSWKGTDGYLPTPSASNIPGADGYWYDAATGDAYTPKEIPSNRAATYVAVNPIKAPVVTVVGEAIYGSTLTARVSGQPADTTATSYQWQYYDKGQNAWYNSNLPGAQTDTLTLTKNPNGGSCEGFELRCVVSTTAGKKRVPQGVSQGVGPVVKMALTGSVRIEGEPVVGSTLTAVVEGVQPDTQLEYRWYRDSEIINTAKGAIYRPTEADLGLQISCRMSDKSGKYKDAVTSNRTNPVGDGKISAYAIYSSTNSSLCFYKRDGIPKTGTTFNELTVTKVYEGFESAEYGQTEAPWLEFKNDIKSVLVIDEIMPRSLDTWFMGCTAMNSADVSNINLKKVTGTTSMFNGCIALKSVTMFSDKSTRVLTSTAGMFYNCSSLTEIDLSNLRTGAPMLGNCSRMFYGCSSLKVLNLSSLYTQGITFPGSSMMDMYVGCNKLQKVTFSDGYEPYPGGALPNPNPLYIPGADGLWYAESDGVGYKPEEIGLVADTFYASRDLLPSVTAGAPADGPSECANAGDMDMVREPMIAENTANDGDTQVTPCTVPDGVEGVESGKGEDGPPDDGRVAAEVGDGAQMVELCAGELPSGQLGADDGGGGDTVP